MKSKAKILSAINHPLGFFALALLIVESSLAVVLIWSDLEPSQKFYGMWALVGLFVILIIMVFLLVWFKPKNLTFVAEDHLRDKGEFGTETHIIDEEKAFKEEKTDKEGRK